MLLMSVGAGLPQTDGTAEPHAEGSACQVCGYSPETAARRRAATAAAQPPARPWRAATSAGQSYGDYAQHAFTETAHSSGVHWNVCAACGLEELSSLAPHSWELTRRPHGDNFRLCVPGLRRRSGRRRNLPPRPQPPTPWSPARTANPTPTPLRTSPRTTPYPSPLRSPPL